MAEPAADEPAAEPAPEPEPEPEPVPEPQLEGEEGLEAEPKASLTLAQAVDAQLTSEAFQGTVLPEWVALEVAEVSALTEIEVEGGGATPVALELAGNASPERCLERLTSRHLFPLVEALCGNPHVVELDLSYNALDDAAALAVARLLKSTPALVRLSLRGCRIGEAGGKAIAEALPESQLAELILAGNPIGDEAGAAIGLALDAGHGLLSLDIGDTHAGSRTLIALSIALSPGLQKGHGLSQLEFLSVARAMLPLTDSTAARHLGKALRVNTSLKLLDLSRSNFNDDDAAILFSELGKNHSLQSLRLSGNSFSCVAGRIVGIFLQSNGSICELDLSGNALTDNGVEEFNSALAYNSVLEALSLSHCGIKDRGLVSIGEGLSANEGSRLQSLCLFGNHFGELSCELYLGLQESRPDLITDFCTYLVENTVEVCRV